MGNYKVVKQAINYELANFLFNYFLLKRESVAHMYNTNMTYDTGILGTFTDKQVLNTYSIYGDPAFDTLLMKMLPVMKRETGLDVIPTYSYARIYSQDSFLKPHKDREECEISCSMFLGGTKWDFFIENEKIDLNIGDMVIYEGKEVEHWREPFKEESECVQAMLHYQRENNPLLNAFDGRGRIALPERYSKYA